MINFLIHLPKELAVVITACLPIFELRGAIPLGLYLGLPLGRVFLFSILGNLLPVIPMLFLLEPLSAYLRKFPLLRRFFDWLFERTQKKAKIIERYEALGLIIFVAIPLPLTGAWSGCVAASLFKIRFRYALLAITLGVILAGVIVSVLSLMGIFSMKHLM